MESESRHIQTITTDEIAEEQRAWEHQLEANPPVIREIAPGTLAISHMTLSTNLHTAIGPARYQRYRQRQGSVRIVESPISPIETIKNKVKSSLGRLSLR